MTEPPACLARRPVSNRTVRVPKLPLSIVASANVISGPSMGPPLHLFLSTGHRRCARLCPSGWGRVPRPPGQASESPALRRRSGPRSIGNRSPATFSGAGRGA
ncbi:hypothetical protein [Ornithinimicrobium kibberense]|uniref:hypothetical protein n=1 Tax=Ornithinimicrobium kibberense TaxID=282060 RepID=UPI0036086019